MSTLDRVGDVGGRPQQFWHEMGHQESRCRGWSSDLSVAFMVPGDSHCLGRNRGEILPLSSKRSCSNSSDTVFLEVKVFDLLKSILEYRRPVPEKKLGVKLALELQRPRPPRLQTR